MPRFLRSSNYDNGGNAFRGQASSSASAPGPSNNPTPGPPTYIPQPNPARRLEKVRILQQDRAEPDNTPRAELDSQTFRVAAFSLHFALSLLESRRGRETLAHVGRLVWMSTSVFDKPDSILKGNVAGDPNVMHAFVDRFLASCRRDPPNYIISNRIEGDGLTNRVDWPNFLGKSEAQYNAKWAALFRLNKVLVDRAITAANRRDNRALRNTLYVLGIAVAHELVHLFVGYIYGKPERDTPPPVNYPARSNTVAYGEAGRRWEKEYFGYIITHYQEPHRHGDTTQPGVFYAMKEGNLAHEVNIQWIDRMITMDFSREVELLPTPKQQPFKVGVSRRPMAALGPPRNSKDFKVELKPYFQRINAMPTDDVGNANLAHIMRMARDYRNVTPPAAA